MSGLWRSAVDWHATTLNSELSSIFSLLADQADESGTVRPEISALAWKSRTNSVTVRRAIESLTDAGLLHKVKPSVWGINPLLLTCQSTCICPRRHAPSAFAPGEALPALPTPLPSLAPPVRAPRQDGGDPPVLKETIECEKAWREAFKTEPAPGLLRGLVTQMSRGDLGIANLGAAFREYLRRISDPMYINLPKFASTWRVYLEPAKASAPKEGASDAAFAKVFLGGDDRSLSITGEGLNL